MVSSVTASPIGASIGVTDSPSGQRPDRQSAHVDDSQPETLKLPPPTAPVPPPPAVANYGADGFSAALIAQRILPKAPSTAEQTNRRPSGWKAPESSLRLTDRSA